MQELLSNQRSLTGSIIDLYVERILQPKSDATFQHILFLPTTFFEVIKAYSGPGDNRGVQFFRRYEVPHVNKFAFICNCPGHYFTIIVENSGENPIISIFDSMSTDEFESDEIIILLQRVLDTFSEVLGINDKNVWKTEFPLKTVLQKDGVNCGIWAILFAETCLNGYSTIDNLSQVNIISERERIAKEIATLLNFPTYHESFTKEGAIYKHRNPESEAFMPTIENLLPGITF
jgi:Ulp1 family protease